MPDEKIIISIVGAIFAVLGWLLKNKDAAQQRVIESQQKSIDLLFDKHDKDAEALKKLELHVAGEHYKRAELDTRFDKLEDAFREELRDLGKKFDGLSAAILEGRK